MYRTVSCMYRTVMSSLSMRADCIVGFQQCEASSFDSHYFCSLGSVMGHLWSIELVEEDVRAPNKRSTALVDRFLSEGARRTGEGGVTNLGPFGFWGSSLSTEGRSASVATTYVSTIFLQGVTVNPCCYVFIFFFAIRKSSFLLSSPTNFAHYSWDVWSPSPHPLLSAKPPTHHYSFDYCDDENGSCPQEQFVA